MSVYITYCYDVLGCYRWCSLLSILIMVVVQVSCVYIQYPISKTPCVGEAVYKYGGTGGGPRPAPIAARSAL